MAKRAPKSDVAFTAARSGRTGSEDAADEHRGFPRIATATRFSLWMGDGAERRFSASLPAVDLSVSGAFLHSSFFLPLRTELRVSFQPDQAQEPVQARALIVREEKGDASPAAKAGFGIRFLEFYGHSEVTLAKLFLGPRLLGFAQRYLQSKRARTLDSELARIVDALAAWELTRVTTGQDPWER